MFYHIIIEKNEKIGKKDEYLTLYEFDKDDLEKIKTDLVFPYVNQKPIRFDGFLLEHKDIRRFKIKRSEKSSQEIHDILQREILVLGFNRECAIEDATYTNDISNDVFKSIEQINNTQTNTQINNNIQANIKDKKINMKKIFIVHGHDEKMRIDVARIIEKLGFESVILQEQVNAGSTIIEKIEKNSDVGYGIVLYSACDIGSKKEEKKELRPRARQNVVFEHGYLMAKLGRDKILALVEKDIEKPSDIDGMLYLEYDDQDWKLKFCKELKNAGYDVDMNKL